MSPVADAELLAQLAYPADIGLLVRGCVARDDDVAQRQPKAVGLFFHQSQWVRLKVCVLRPKHDQHHDVQRRVAPRG